MTKRFEQENACHTEQTCHSEFSSESKKRPLTQSVMLSKLRKQLCPLPQGERVGGFTLAEVLITLGIIGVVAAMTLPSVISNYQTKRTVVKLKKVYTTLEQAWKMAIAEEGDPSNWDLLGFDSSEGAENLANILEPYLNVAKNCGTSSGCWYDDTIVSLTGSPSYGNINSSIFSKMVLNDGSMIAFATRSGNCSAVRGTSASLQNSCAIAFIDINGNQPPNTFGKDVFYFVLTKYNVVPMGSTFDTTYTFEKYCKTGTSSYGLGCTAWVIYNENMDYLKCSDLSWEEKSGCD